MANIVYISVGMGSTLHSSLELGRRLDEAGHEVTFVSHVDIGDWVGLYGFRFVRLIGHRQAEKQSNADPMPKPSWRNTRCMLRWILRQRRIRRQSIENDEIETLVSRQAPDMLLIDIECHYAVIATAGLGIPTVLTMFWFSTFRRPGLPPLHIYMMPDGGLKHQLAIGTAWLRLWMETRRLEWRRRFSRRGLKAALNPVSYGTVHYSDLKSVARHYRYRLARETERFQWLRPYMYRCLPIITFNAWEMEFPHTPHPNLHYVGPMLNPHRPEPYTDVDSAKCWARFKDDYRHEAKPRRRVVYFSLGSYLSPDQQFLKQVLAVAERRSDWVFILGLGGLVDRDGFALVPANVLVLNWAPQLDVLKIADCAVIHAGISTINECIYCQVPMVIHSTHTVDQDGTAARIAFHRLGVVADKRRDSSEQVERNIERALMDEAMRRNLAAMKGYFLTYQTSNAAVSALEKILAGKEKPT